MSRGAKIAFSPKLSGCQNEVFRNKIAIFLFYDGARQTEKKKKRKIGKKKNRVLGVGGKVDVAENVFRKVASPICVWQADKRAFCQHYLFWENCPFSGFRK